MTQPLAGRAVAVWSPEVEPCWGRAALAASLVREALEHYQIRGFRIAQALVDGSGPASGTTDLTRGGLKAITVLTYMKRDTQKPVEPKRADSLPVGFVWQPYAPETEALFRQTLQRTYEGSLDMPELDGIRSLDDVIACSTWHPAREIPHEELGNLSVGAPADVAVLRLTHGNFGFVDSAKLRLRGDQKLVAELTISSGKIVWDLNGMSSEDWDHAPRK